MRERPVVVGLLVAVLTFMSGFVDTSVASAAARDINSYNWAGYAVRGPAMDAIVLEFTVPQVTCTRANQAMSIWAGFGGLREQSLVQAGVQVRCNGTNPQYELFEQLTRGSGGSTVGPQVLPGDYVRVVVCPAPSGLSTGVCAGGAPQAANFQTSVAFKRGGTGDYQLWRESLTPKAWVNTRTEAECIAERPRDAATEALLELPQFTVPVMRCTPYRSISPISRVNVANGGAGYSALRLSIVPTPPSAVDAQVGRAVAPGELTVAPEEATRTLTATGDADPLNEPQVSPAAARPIDLPIGGSPVTFAP